VYSTYIDEKNPCFNKKTRLDVRPINNKERHMANRLYVGGLPYRTTEDEFKAAFAQAGTVVSASIISDRMSGRSKGFGFIEMETESQAQAAIALWHGKEFDGRVLTVNEARPMEERPRTQKREYSGSGSRSESRY